MIEVQNLTKRYGSKIAVNNISFSVSGGEILGFLGPNGAGKSTIMNIITGYLSSTEGAVTVGGCDILTDPIKVKRQIGFLPEQPPLYFDMTVKEYLGFIFDLKKVKTRKRSHVDEICEQVRIGDVKKRLIKNLSKGYRQRVGLAQALLGNPPVLILDEPTIGLDPKQIIEMRNLILELGQQRTVILSSHILSEIQAVCKRIIIIHQGVLVADGTPEALSASLSDARRLILRVVGPEAEVQAALSALPGVRSAGVIGSTEEGAADFSLEPQDDADVRQDVFFALAEKRWPLLSMRTNELSLEEIFLRLTTEHAPGADEESGVAAPEASHGPEPAAGSMPEAEPASESAAGFMPEAESAPASASAPAPAPAPALEPDAGIAEGGDAQ